MSEIAWKDGTIHKGNADKVYKEISSLGESYTADDIVNYAKEHPDSELYKEFEWDDEKAAASWRKQQARFIVCHLVVKETAKDDEQPTEYRIIQRGENAYMPVKMIFRNDDEYNSLLNRAKTELMAFQKRYKEIAELELVLDVIDEFLADI